MLRVFNLLLQNVLDPQIIRAILAYTLENRLITQSARATSIKLA
jgi:hypothetical protein